MTDSQTPTYRSHTTPTGDRIEYRQPDEDANVFEVRMPIATTGEVRNKGDDPLTRDELDGMARQINEGGLGVFLDHGGSDLGGPKPYSAIGKIGEWNDATLDSERDDGEDALMATARMMDPESLPAGVNELRAAVGAIKEQVKRDFSISSSIGWREDESYPGGNDLMEASIVGIGADPRTTSQASDDAGLVARAAVEAGADAEELVATVREAVGGERDSEATQDMTDDDTPDDGGTTEQEQTTDRAPDDVSEDQLLTFTAMHYDGMDESDLADAVGTADGEYMGAVDVEALTELVATATDTEYDDAADAMTELMGGGEDEQEGGKPDDYDEDEEDEEQSADTESETDEQQSVDEELSERVAELEAALDDVRSGEDEVESPDDNPTESELDERDADINDEPSGNPDDWRKHAHN